MEINEAGKQGYIFSFCVSSTPEKKPTDSRSLYVSHQTLQEPTKFTESPLDQYLTDTKGGQPCQLPYALQNPHARRNSGIQWPVTFQTPLYVPYVSQVTETCTAEHVLFQSTNYPEFLQRKSISSPTKKCDLQSKIMRP